MSIAERLPGEVSVHDDPVTVAQAVAAWVQAVSMACVRRTRRFTIALAGGDIAAQVHHALAEEPWRSEIEWDAWHVYFGDERAVSPDDESSNYHMACETLLDHVPVNPELVHRMPADAPDLDAAAAEYARLLAAQLPAGALGAPRLDCILLGIGENGHTASLFPGTDAADVADAWATRGRADYKPYDRMTLTLPCINAAAAVAFCVTGSSKREALQHVIDGTAVAARVRPRDGALRWFLDSAAAR